MLALIESLGDRYEQSVILRRDSPLHRRLAAEADPALGIVPVPSSVPAAVGAARRVGLLHVHEGRSVQVGAWASLSGTRFVVTRRVPNSPKHDLFTRWFYSRASATVGVSEAVSEVMRTYLGGHRVETILDHTPRLPVNAANVAALRERYRGKIVVGHVGELHDSHKGQMVILEAARTALRQYPRLHFVLVGSGCDGPAMRERARDLPNVEFVGWVDNVGDYYSAMNLFAFPSREEALGSAILEAMSHGLPVVGAAVGGIPEIVTPGVNGLLFRSGDADAMLARIVEVAVDPALGERLAVGARASAQARDVGQAAAQYAAVYERVAGSPARVSTPGAQAAVAERHHGTD